MENKGLTLVELMIALAVSSVVILAANFLLSSSSNNYQHEKSQISLQTEAQTAINQISDMLLEAESAAYTPTVSGGSLTIISSKSSGGAIDVRTVYQDGSKLYLDMGVSGGALMVEHQLLADYISGFQYEADSYASEGITADLGKLTLELKYSDSEKIYQAENTVKLRNSQKK